MVLEAGRRPLTGVAVGLAAAARDVLAGPPGGVLVGVLLLGLERGQALPGPEEQLAQPGVDHGLEPGRQRQRRDGRAGPDEVAGEQHRRRHACQRLRRGLGLGASDVVQRRVDLALDAAPGVVAGAAVAEQHHAPRLAQEGLTTGRPAPRSASRSTNGMTGQSFHSRSRA